MDTRINGRLTKLKAVAVGGLVKRHKQASFAVAVDLFIAGALLAGTGGKPSSSTSYPVGARSGGPQHHRPGRASDCADQGPAADATATGGCNSATERHSVTAINLASPSTTGRLEELME